MNLASTSIPWLFGGFGLVAIVTLLQTVRAWHEAKRSPYFFMRRQAQRRMQQYGVASLIVLSLTSAAAFYSWSPPADEVLRFAVIAQAKPVEASVTLDQLASSVSRDEPVVAARSEAVRIPVASLVTAPLYVAEETLAAFARRGPSLPAEFRDVYEPEASLSALTKLGAVSFSQEIDAAYVPMDPQRIFEPGFYTVYATFDYEGMSDGLEWAWVWLRDGEPVSGGTQLWQYGSAGPGYVYLNPEEGFGAGQYALQIWVNEQMLAESSLIVTTAAASR